MHGKGALAKAHRFCLWVTVTAEVFPHHGRRPLLHAGCSASGVSIKRTSWGSIQRCCGVIRYSASGRNSGRPASWKAQAAISDLEAATTHILALISANGYSGRDVL